MSGSRAGRRPLIGITAYRERTRWSHWDREADVLPASYADCVADAGGTPVLLPACPDVTADAVVHLDGVVLSGGPDVDPALYGVPAHAATGEARQERDGAELAVLAAAVAMQTPVLAVCRGAQLLNVWCGGTLDQHLPELGGRLDHGAGGRFAARTVRVAPGSWVSSVLGTSTRVSCHHHQAVRDLGPGLHAVAWAEDGTIEAVELKGPGLVAGVQWHPEEESSPSLFAALVEASRGNPPAVPSDGARARSEGVSA